MDIFVSKSASVALLLLLTSSSVMAQEMSTSLSKNNLGNAVTGSEKTNQESHLIGSSTIGDILRHPVFEGFGNLILPWDNRAYDERMPLSNISSLLPYHSNVNTEVVVRSLNHMVDDAGKGKKIFFDFYTKTQKLERPARANTGLFFFRGKPGAPFAIIAPGGGFSYVGSVHEGFPYAVEISKKGYNAFVLRYQAGYGGAVATEDLAAALSFIVSNAEVLGVSPDNYSLWGSSAGARMAAAIGTYGAAKYGGSIHLPKPSAVVMAYTAHSDYSANDPPTFMAVGEQDGISPAATMERRAAALRKVGVKVEFHRYRNLGHGFGLGTGTSAEGWVGEAIRFWREQIQTKN